MYQWPAVVSDYFKSSGNVANENVKEQFLFSQLIKKIKSVSLKFDFLGKIKL